MGPNSLSFPEDPALLAIAHAVRSRGKAADGLVRSTLLILCRDRFLTLKELGGLLNRNLESLRRRFLAPMVQEGLLERRYPSNPNHEHQAYRTLPKEG